MTDIVILDFGSQTTHLLQRRMHEFGLTCEIIDGDTDVKNIQNLKPYGLILSGGPSSVYAKNGLLPDKRIFDLKIPILAICYGLEIVAYLKGGRVDKGIKGEYGKTSVKIISHHGLFKDIPDQINSWMSHFDMVSKMPKYYELSASTSSVKYSGFENIKEKVFCLQFHPEVVHTEYGIKILDNFAKFCGLKIIAFDQKKYLTDYIDRQIKIIKDKVSNKKVICALSGGVDSAVSAVIVQKAIGNRLRCLYIDTGMMREGETEQIINSLKKLKLAIKVINAKDEFINNLKGIINPETKRKIIGNTFIEIFDRECKKLADIEYLVQGTIYPDVIESQGSRFSKRIKTHHNVGGLPENMKLKLLEPLRGLYKDEVRQLADILHFPGELVHRQPFPGPGLAVRIIGEVTKEKLDLLRKADLIIREEVEKNYYYQKLWMYFGILTGVKTTGVVGDERRYGETIAIRALQSKDAMTADTAPLPYPLLEKISNRITTEVPDVCRVVYDITSKPPGTMEWE